MLSSLTLHIPRASSSSSHYYSSLLLLILIFLSIPLGVVRAQFRFDDLLGGIGLGAAQKIMGVEPGEQSDPLRKVFGTVGRLLNRMAQQNPPSDDELHLKPPSEEGNGVGEDPEAISGAMFPPRGEGVFGGGTAGKSLGSGGGSRSPASGPDRIIDEQRLNAILPRLNPNSKTKATSEATQATTTPTTPPPPPPPPPTTTTTTTTTTTSTTSKATRKMGRRRKTKRKKNAGGVVPNGTTMPLTIGTVGTAENGTNTTTSSTTTFGTLRKAPPMSILRGNVAGEEQNNQPQQQTWAGSTVRWRTSRELEARLNETVLTRMENETAQLIAEIENVLADAEMGPNGGHWLKQHNTTIATIPTTTTPPTTATMTTTPARTTTVEKTTTTSMTTPRNVSEGEEAEDRSYEGEEEDAEDTGDEEEGTSNEEEDGENEEEEGSDATSKSQQQTTMTATTSATMTTSTTTTTTGTPSNATTAAKMKGNGTRKGIPEAEEEDQQQLADIAQLQLDSAATVSSTPTTTGGGDGGSSTQTPQSAQNIFNLNANANAYANPNFSNVMKPVNSIIDGIGPLILPLIGYSQRAFDAYAPYAQRTEGVSLFSPPAGLIQPGESAQSSPVALRQQSPGGMPLQQQQQARPLIPIQTNESPPLPPENALQRPTPSQTPQQFPPPPPPIPVPSPRRISPQPQLPPRQVPSGQDNVPNPNMDQQQLAVPNPPSLELLGQIIEQRKSKERKGIRKQQFQQQQQPIRNGVQEVSGSSPFHAEQSYFPPDLSRGASNQPSESIPNRPPPPTPPEAKVATDRGYDVGRQTVQTTFHEDSGLMLGAHKPQPPPMGSGGGGGGFGNGRRPTAEPSKFTH